MSIVPGHRTRAHRPALGAAAWLLAGLSLAFAGPVPASVLTFLEVERNNVAGVDGLDGPDGLAVSPDGLHVYVASFNDDAVAVFRRDPATGALTFFELQRDGVGDTEGLDGVRALAVSPDGAHVYAAANIEDAVSVFSRDPATGALMFEQVLIAGPGNANGVNGAAALTVSPDGRQIYVATFYDMVTVLSRDPATGQVAYLERHVDNMNGVDGLNRGRAVAVSPDGGTVYVAGALDDAIAVFRRDPESGLLTFLQVIRDTDAGVNGLDHVQGLAISPDGACLYAVGGDDDALAVLRRDTATGLLTFVEVERDDLNVVDGLNGAQAVAVSPDGTAVYATGEVDDALAVFRRDAATCALTFAEVHRNRMGGVFGLDGAQPLVASPDGRNVYAGGFVDDAVTVLYRPCGDGILDAGEQCDDGDTRNGDCCSSTCQFEATGSTCDDGNACTQTDTCATGTCAGANPVTCTALDQCHTAGTCDPATGTCSNPARPDGTTCSDANACTQTDTCVAGTCTGTDPVVCTACDQCHTAGICDPATGTCSDPARPDGSACDDADACTRTDTCTAGACMGANPLTCTALDQCHTAGTCDPATGTCSDPARPDGAACTDGNACTRTDTCAAGTCMGANPLTCTALDQCHAAGTCNPATGTCSDPARPDGAACTDGNACTRTDTCAAGTCTGTDPVTCTALDQCHAAGTCDPATGTCSNPARLDGSACTDGNACTRTDTCAAGTCTGTDPVTCTALDQCHTAGTCDPATGTCSDPARPDGSACTDGNACTVETCAAGVCQPMTMAGCTPCVADGDCDDSRACTADECALGMCVFEIGPTCPTCYVDEDCDDGDFRTRDTCSGGICEHVPTEVCGDGTDNDGDTLVDCADSDCASAPLCTGGVELCGDCQDNDGDGLADYEDPDCCTEVTALRVRRLLMRPASVKARDRLKLRTVYAGITPAGFNPLAQDTTLQISDADGQLFCTTIAANHFMRGRRKSFMFWDKAGAFANGLSDGRFRLRGDGSIRFKTHGRRVRMRTMHGSSVRITIRVGSQCSQTSTTLRTWKTALVFP